MISICSGVGKIFVLFLNIDGATKARAAVNGRTFNGKLVEAVFYPEDLLDQKVGSIAKLFCSANVLTPHFFNI